MGRRAGIAIFFVIFAGATLLWTIQILTAVWGDAPPSALGCEKGTARLLAAVTRARAAQAAGQAKDNERVALSRYRAALEPEWATEHSVEAACRADRAGLKRLKDVIALRYAEEHAVRYESLGLAPLRHRLNQPAQSPTTELIR